MSILHKKWTILQSIDFLYTLILQFVNKDTYYQLGSSQVCVEIKKLNYLIFGQL